MLLDFRPLRRLVGKRSQKPHNGVHHLSLLALPTELWIHILSFLNKQADLLRLCMTSKSLHFLVMPIIYRCINLDMGAGEYYIQKLNQHKLEVLLRTIQDPQLAAIVSEFRIVLPRCREEGISLYALCSCDPMDQTLGEILSLLSNLQVLYIDCSFHVLTPTNRHSYLRNLGTTKLQKMGFGCLCFGISGDKVAQILMAPYMRSITTLQWERGHLDLSTLSSDEHLPQVKELICREPELFDRLLQMGTITSLQCTDVFGELPTILAQSPLSLTRLQTGNTGCILAAININYGPYRNIRHFGYFKFVMRSPDEIITPMKLLARLPVLESVEIWLRFQREHWTGSEHPYRMPRKDFLVRDLGQALPSLRKAHFKISWSSQTYEYLIWEKSDSWNLTQVDEIDGWEMKIQGFG